MLQKKFSQLFMMNVALSLGVHVIANCVRLLIYHHARVVKFLYNHKEMNVVSLKSVSASQKLAQLLHHVKLDLSFN